MCVIPLTRKQKALAKKKVILFKRKSRRASYSATRLSPIRRAMRINGVNVYRRGRRNLYDGIRCVVLTSDDRVELKYIQTESTEKSDGFFEVI